MIVTEWFIYSNKIITTYISIKKICGILMENLTRRKNLSFFFNPDLQSVTNVNIYSLM